MPAFFALLIIFLPFPLATGAGEYQENWSPNTYKLAKLQIKTLACAFPGGAMPVFVLVLMIMFSFHLQAQTLPYQVDWIPGNFYVVCQQGHPCPLNREQSERVARMMSEALDGMKKMPFRPPQDWGKRVGQGTANDYIELYQRGAVLAAAAPSCDNAGRGRSDMLVGPNVTGPCFEGKDYGRSFFFRMPYIPHELQTGKYTK